MIVLAALRLPIRYPTLLLIGLIGALLLGVAVPRTVAAAPDAANENHRWSDAFGAGEFDAPAYAFAEYERQLIAGGLFRQAAGVPAHFIARWDRHHWWPLGEGFQHPVNALLAHEGFLYAGCWNGAAPENDGGVRFVGRWDGRSWTDMSANLRGASFGSFFLLKGDLYAAGRFFLGGVDVDCPVIRWNGAGWDSVPFPGLRGTLYLKAVTEAETAFLSTGERIDQWDGSNWKTLADFSCYLEFCNRVHDIAIHRGDLYAAGDFHRIHGVPASHLARYRNGEWEAVDPESPTEGYALALCSSSRGLLVSGGFHEPLVGSTIALWTGDAWERMGEGQDYPPFEIAEIGSDVVVGGWFFRSGSTRTPWCARWDGSEWSPLEHRGGPEGAGLLDPTTIEGMTATGSRLYVAGSINWRGTRSSTALLHSILGWDGREWAFVPDPFTLVRPVIGNWQDRLMAAGVIGSGGRDWANSVKQWDGSAWHDLADTLVGRVQILASDDRTILAGGSFPLAALDRWASVMEWNGVAWFPLGFEMNQARSNIRGLALVEGTPIAVGSIRSASLPTGTPIARWDGTDWQPIGAGVSGLGLAVTSYRGQLVVGGRLTIDGRSVDLLQWDGSRWVEFPGAPVWADGKEFIDLQVIGDDLYVVGLASVDGRRVNAIARWDGHQWHSLGSGVLLGLAYPQGNFMSEFQGDLFVAGALTVAGEKSSSHIARWSPGRSSPGHSAHRQRSTRPAEDQQSALRFELAAPARIEIEIFDLQGRRVAKPVDTFEDAGLHSYTWDGHGADGTRLPAGLYFARRRVAGEALAPTRIVLAR